MKLKSLSCKIIMTSTFFSIVTVNMIAPISIFASELQPAVKEKQEQNSLVTENAKVIEMLKKTGSFASTMNRYSLTLLKSSDIDFGNIQIPNHENLPQKIKEDQKSAREHALLWDKKIKFNLIDNIENIISYNAQFQNYYSLLVDAANNKDTEVLKEGLTDLQAEVKKNKKMAIELITALKELRDLTGTDSRNFNSHQGILATILEGTKGIEDDKKNVMELMEKLKEAESLRDKGIYTVCFPSFMTWIAGGIVLAIANSQLDELRPLLDTLNRTVTDKESLQRSVLVAQTSMKEIHDVINSAIYSLTYMATQWDDLDSQYNKIVESINQASDKAESNKFMFMIPILNTAKDKWYSLEQDAKILKEGLKDLEGVTKLN